MKKARQEDPNITYKTYLMVATDRLSPVADAARKLAWSDKWLEKVGQQVVLFQVNIWTISQSTDSNRQFSGSFNY